MNCFDRINDVILMGGVADKNEVAKNIKPINGNLFNLHSEKDFILKYLFKLVKLSIDPVGNYKIDETS